MVWLILATLLCLGLLAGIKLYNIWADVEGSGVYAKKRRKVKYIVAFIPLVLVLFSVFSVVSSGEVGIKTVFGKISSDTVSEGISLKAPWEDVEKISVKVQKYENAVALEASTKDLQVISGVKVVVNYQVIPERAPELYRVVGKDFSSVILEPAIQESVKAEFAHYDAEELANKRSEVAFAIEENLNGKMLTYGIRVSGVGIQNFDYSPAYNHAIETKAVAVQEALAAKERLEKTKAEAEQKVVMAEAEAKANELLDKSLSDNVIREMWINKWNGVVPQVVSDGGYMVNLGK